MRIPKVRMPVRLKGERAKAYGAFCDYCQMGDGRSLRKLCDEYRGRSDGKPGAEIPTQGGATLERWSSRFGWQERVEEYDLSMREARQADIEKEALTGLATTKNRIHELKKLANDISRMICAEDHDFDISHPGHRPFLWLKEVKVIGSGPLAYPANVYRYNSAIIGDYRGLLDDLARETGGRKHLVDVTSADNRITLAGARTELENLSLDDLAARYRDITHQ